VRPDHRRLDTSASPALEAIPHMPDQIIDAVTGRSIHADAVRTHPLAAWVIARDQIDYPGKLVARLVTDVPTSYVLLSDTLAGLQAQLPPGLVRSERQQAEPPEVVEIWFADAAPGAPLGPG
jgi:hypothetical protein